VSPDLLGSLDAGQLAQLVKWVERGQRVDDLELPHALEAFSWEQLDVIALHWEAGVCRGGRFARPGMRSCGSRRRHRGFQRRALRRTERAAQTGTTSRTHRSDLHRLAEQTANLERWA